MAHSDAAETNRQRAAIDGGHAGDKAPGLDPAASPMGTDDEAAGTTPQRAVTPAGAGATQAKVNSPSPEIAPAGQPSTTLAVKVGLMAAVVMLAAGAVFAFLPGF